MSLVAIVIVACLGGYTFVRLHYAKPGKPHEPYAEGRQRAADARLAAAGWKHFAADYEQIVDFPAPRDNVAAAPARPPAAQDLFLASSENWHLPVEYTRVTAPASVSSRDSYTVYVDAELDQARAQIEGFDLYQRQNDVLAIPRWTPVPAELVPRRNRSAGRLLWPAGALPAGRYRVTLLALKQSAAWDLEIAGP